MRAGDLYEAVRISLAILSDIKKMLLSEDECMKHGYVYGGDLLLDDPRELGYTFAYDTEMMDATYRSISERAELYKGITPERIREAARAIFKAENMILGIKGAKRKINSSELEAIIDDFKADKLTLN